MSTAIQKIEPQVVSTIRVAAMETALNEEGAIRELVAKYVAAHMVVGTDYGVMPGTDRETKCLFKPGSQKLISLFRCKPVFKLVESVTDLERGYFSYMFRVRLISRDTKEVLAEGYGSCNSKEGKYRWRDAQRKCPSCSKTTLFKSKRPGEGFYCWEKKGGCGAKFAESDTAVTSQVLGKVENEDVATLANTILKMAKKRAEVDGAITLANVADLFTQDLEDAADAPEVQPNTENRYTPNEPPKPSASSTLPARPADFKAPFGKGAGKIMSELSDEELEDQAKLAGKSKKEGKFAAANVQWLKATQDELARRAFGSGAVRAPEQTSARVSQSPPKNRTTEEGEEIVTPTARMIQLGRMHGLAPNQIASRAKGVTGKDTGWTHDDVEKVALSIQAVPA